MSEILSVSQQNASNPTKIQEKTKNLIDYACFLKEKTQLEREVSLLKHTNSSLISQIYETEHEYALIKHKLELNEELVDSLKNKLEETKQNLANEQQVYKSYSTQHEIIITDLRRDVKLLRKNLCCSTAQLNRAEKQMEGYKQKCLDYKDKLRGFAILFTYFNDPKRNEAVDVTVTNSESSSLLLSNFKKSDQGVQLECEAELSESF